jgi:hypothetical protein
MRKVAHIFGGYIGSIFSDGGRFFFNVIGNNFWGDRLANQTLYIRKVTHIFSDYIASIFSE